jgi:hypothetical protein
LRISNGGSFSANFDTGRTTQRFSEYGYRVTKKGKCTVCGKQRQVSEDFTQTSNPYNNKTSSQIYEQTKAKADKWAEKPLICKSCKAEAWRDRRIDE